MVTVTLRGRVLPAHISVTATAPELSWKWQQENIDIVIRVQIENSVVIAECDLPKYEPSYGSELFKRASDIARASANMAAFATGIGLLVVIEQLIDPNGQIVSLHRKEEIPPGSRTAFDLDPNHHVEFDRALRAIVSEPSLFIALDDLINTLTSQHTQLANCGRVIDRVRRMIVPDLDGAAAWVEMHRALNISRPYQEWISQRSTGPRHGDGGFQPGDVCSEAIRRTWAVLNRFIEYRKRGNVTLNAPDFPLLE